MHLSVNAAPAYRIHGKLRFIGESLTSAATESFARTLMSPRQWQMYQEQGDLDFAYTAAGVRFRVNVFRQQGFVSLAVRVIRERIPTLKELELPVIVNALAKKKNGFILVTGPTGSGKSTTLAALLNHINETRPCHIITLEDPIEYLHPHKQAVVNQREIGRDTKGFVDGLRASLRQDPDVILLGEMRDVETIQTAVTAAETGHLVLATMHTGDSLETIHRIIDAYPGSQQAQIRSQLAMVLQGVIAQHLVCRKDGNGRIAAVEVLVNTPAIANLIRSAQIHQIRSVLQTGKPAGMQTMEMHLEQLFMDRKIGRQTLTSEDEIL